MADGSNDKQGGSPVARQVAYSMILVVTVALAVSFPASLMGNWSLVGQVCMGSGVLLALMLLVGGLVVASNRERNAD